jgi:aspartate kinase
MIVMKFGGSSLASADAIHRVSGVVAAQAERRPLVVVSAMGKTTDRLLSIAESAAAGDLPGAARQADELKSCHLREAGQVVADDARGELEAFVETHFLELMELAGKGSALEELTPRFIDAISSFGERLSSFVISLALGNIGIDAAYVDSRQVIITDDRFSRASPLLDLTNQRLNEKIPPLLEQHQAVVMGGFIASTTEGVTSTLGRGGSDYTASLVGAALGAEEIQIWTDVDGVMTADPTIQSDARRLRVMSFAEASELAYFGARVLHPSTMLPAVKSNIPIRVLNSHRPDVEGTLVVSECPPSSTTVKSIAYKEDITVVDIRSTRMLMAHGYLAKIFEVFDRLETPVDMVSTSEVEVSLTIDRTERLAEITDELQRFAEVTHSGGQAIVCLVGDNLRYTPGIAGKIFTAIEGINIRMISQGASRLNVSFVIDEKDLRSAVQALHGTFFATVDDDVFA